MTRLAVFVIVTALFGNSIAKEVGSFQKIQSERISGGEEAIPHEFPYVVVIESGYRCTGVILNEEYVLTSAAACGDGYQSTVIAGEHDRTTTEGTETRHTIIKTTRHPRYLSSFWDFFDLAILQVSPKFEFNKYIQPANITEEFDHESDSCTICGWGATDYTGNWSPVLIKAKVPFVPYEQCAARVSAERLTPDVVCYGGGDDNASTCSGDRAAPLICGGKVAGLKANTYGYSCDSTPGIFTNLANYHGFIRHQIMDYPKDPYPLVMTKECGGKLESISGRIRINNIAPNTYCTWAVRMPLENGFFRINEGSVANASTVHITKWNGTLQIPITTRLTDVGREYEKSGPLYYVTFFSGPSGHEGYLDMEFYGNGFGSPDDTLSYSDYMSKPQGEYSYPVEGDYTANEDVFLLVQGEKGATLSFTEFDLDTSPILCYYDNLAVLTWTGTTFLLRSVNCGSDGPNPFQSASGIFLVHFTSNYRHHGRGFTFTWE